MNRDASISFEKDEIGNCAKLYPIFIIAYSIAIATFQNLRQSLEKHLECIT